MKKLGGWLDIREEGVNFMMPVRADDATLKKMPVVPFAFGCGGPQSQSASNLNRPIVPPAGTAGPGGQQKQPQKAVKPES